MTEPKTFLTAVPPAAPVGAEEILEIEKRIRENESALKEESKKRVKEGLALTALRSSTPEDIADTIVRERRRLKAKVHLGDATEADLAKFDKDAAEKKKAIAKQSAQQEAITDLEDVIKLLDEKIAKLEALGKGLVAERHRLWGLYLRELAESAGAEYRAHAEKAFGSLTRVLNLGGILNRLEQRPNGIGVGAREFSIPTLGTESTKLPPEKFSTVGVDTNLFSISSDSNLHKHVNSREYEIFEEFERAGLKWPGPPPPPTMPLELVEPAMKKVKVPGIGEGRPIEIARPPESLRAADGSIAPTQAITE